MRLAAHRLNLKGVKNINYRAAVNKEINGICPRFLGLETETRNSKPDRADAEAQRTRRAVTGIRNKMLFARRKGSAEDTSIPTLARLICGFE